MTQIRQYTLGKIKEPKIEILKEKTEQAEPKFKIVFNNLETFVAERLREINAMSESFKLNKNIPQIKTITKLNDKSYASEIEFYQLARNLVIINKAKSKFLNDKEYTKQSSNISTNDEILVKGLKSIFLYSTAMENGDYTSANVYLNHLNQSVEVLRQKLLKENVDYLIEKADEYLAKLNTQKTDVEKSVDLIENKIKSLQEEKIKYPALGQVASFFVSFIKEDSDKYQKVLQSLSKSKRSKIEYLINAKTEIEITEKFKKTLTNIKEITDLYKLAYSLETSKVSNLSL